MFGRQWTQLYSIYSVLPQVRTSMQQLYSVPFSRAIWGPLSSSFVRVVVKRMENGIIIRLEEFCVQLQYDHAVPGRTTALISEYLESSCILLTWFHLLLHVYKCNSLGRGGVCILLNHLKRLYITLIVWALYCFIN